jgi:hypothetical protein
LKPIQVRWICISISIIITLLMTQPDTFFCPIEGSKDESGRVARRRNKLRSVHFLLVGLSIAMVFAFVFNSKLIAVQSERAAQKPPKKVFISAKFGRNSMFAEHVARYRLQVEATGLFDSDKIHTYADFPDWIMKDPRWSEHLLFLDKPKHSSRKGGGHWFWKSVLIGHHLDELNDGDFLVYSDSDLLNQFKWTNRLMEAMASRDANLALYEMQYLERQYSKRDVYENLCDGMDPTSDKSLSNAGGFVTIRKTPSSVKFVKEWIDNVANIQLISNAPSKLPNIPEFKAHRNDQSILNALLKCRYHSPAKEVLPDTKVDMANSLDKGNYHTPNWKVYTYSV